MKHYPRTGRILLVVVAILVAGFGFDLIINSIFDGGLKRLMDKFKK